MNYHEMIKIASEAAEMAGEEIMNIYNNSKFIDFKNKKDILLLQRQIELHIV